MGLGKWLVVVGLAVNVLAATSMAWRGPRRIPAVVTLEGPSSEPATAFGRFAKAWGWRLLLLGFGLQLVGTILWT